MDTRVLVNQSKMARDQIQLALKRVLKADPEQRTLLRNIEQSEGMLALLGHQPVKPLLVVLRGYLVLLFTMSPPLYLSLYLDQHTLLLGIKLLIQRILLSIPTML